MNWGLLLLCLSESVVLFSIRVTKFLQWCGWGFHFSSIQCSVTWYVVPVI